VTRIVLHPREVSRYGPMGGPQVMLPAPWMWWETRVSTQLEIRWEPERDDIETYIVTFGPDGDRVVLTDPPSLFLINIQQYDDVLGCDFERSLLTASYLTARVVWHTCPGAHWQPVPHVLTCRPGWYQQDSHAYGPRQRYDREAWNGTIPFYERTPTLDWPMNPTIVDGQAIHSTTSAERCRQCQRYIPLWTSAAVEAGDPRVLCEECYRMRRRTNRAPSVEITGPLTDEQVLVFDGQRGGWTLADIETLRGGFVAARQVLREEIAALYGIPGAMLAAVMTPDEIREREGLAPYEPGDVIAPARGRDVTPWMISAIKPEAELVDEIDRLVNEEIRAGPRDDYNLNLYPRCARCAHQWHGILCDQCACLGELEDEV
jgi:hypothetical protein